MIIRESHILSFTYVSIRNGGSTNLPVTYLWMYLDKHVFMDVCMSARLMHKPTTKKKQTLKLQQAAHVLGGKTVSVTARSSEPNDMQAPALQRLQCHVH